MNIRRYSDKTNPGFLDYEFYSEGPRGKIKKVVRVTVRNAAGATYFNLSFGDWIEAKKRLDDKAITNNHDTIKVLASVAAIVLELTANFPDMWGVRPGKYTARTRLYQMGIAATWEVIEPLLFVYG